MCRCGKNYAILGTNHQALVDFLAAHPVPKSSKLHEDISNKIFESNMISEDEVWQMFFDGASRTGPKSKITASVGVVFLSPQNHVLPRAFSLTKPFGPEAHHSSFDDD